MSENLPPQRQWRSVLRFGVLVGLLLAVGLLLGLYNDRRNRLEAAQRQTVGVGVATARLLASGLDNVERTMLSIAYDQRAGLPLPGADARLPLDGNIPSILRRHPELESLQVLDGQGRALSPGPAEPGLPRWTDPGQAGMQVGSVQRASDGRWTLALAVRIDPQRWLLARLWTSELQTISGGAELGRHGLLLVRLGDGTVLASHPSTWVPGSRLPPARLDQVGAVAADAQGVHWRALGLRSSQVDRLRRIGAIVRLPDYPLFVFVAMGEGEVIAPWWTSLGVALAIFAVYLLGLAYLLRSLRRADRRQAQLQAELRAGDEELRLAHQVGGIGTWWIDEDGKQLHWAAQSMAMLGLGEADSAVGTFLDHLHPDDVAQVRCLLATAWSEGEVFDVTCRLQWPGQHERWIAMRGARVDEDGARRRMTGTVVDVSERVQMQARALDAQRQFRLIFEINPLPGWLYDLDSGALLEVNPEAVRQYGYSREQFLAMTLAELQGPGAHVPRPALAGAYLDVHRCRDGRLIDVRVHAAPVDVAGTRACLMVAENVSETLAYQRELKHRASHDESTGLLNVPALAEAMRASPAVARTVVHVRLRGLQLIGDTLGGAIRREVLAQLCLRVRSLVEGRGLLAFQPAEDFVLALDDGRDPARLIKALQTMLAEPVRGRDSLHLLEVRIGVASYPADGASAEEVIGKAGQAAHAAREAGVPVMAFHAGIEARLSARLHLVGQLHEAIEHEQFELHYQPIVAADDGRVVALEALVRWRHPERGLVGPGEFIALCEDTGLIIPLGRWALRQAVADRRLLLDQGWAGLTIAINVSALQFFGTDVAEEVASVCREAGLGQDMLQLELTESCLVRDPEQAMQAMRKLRSQGVRLSLDDFGTGFSSLSYLQHMPLDSLKIDRSFIAGIGADARSAAICRTLIALGHDLGLEVVAEGVEQPGQRAWLLEHGCDLLQGHLIGWPASLAELARAGFGPPQACP